MKAGDNMFKRLLINIKKHISLLYFFGKDKASSIMYQSPNVLSSEQTIEKIIKDKCSISRYGDGEFHLLIQSKDLKFQKRSNELSRRLKNILISDDEGLMVCIPNVFSESDLSMRTNESKKFWKDHVANYRLLWYKHLDRNKTYYNSTFTRNYIAIEDKSNLESYFDKVKKIWGNRDLLIIEGEFSRLGVGNNLFDNANSIQRILAPSENAFEKYDLVLQKAKRHDKEKLVLIALGPTATILSYDLHKLGYQAIDIGHLDVEFEWFLKKTKVRTKIENKYVIEANNRIEDDNHFFDAEYEKQIVDQVV
ncbi:SP_1767 family glycosyltransferase [Bacillus sp. V3B]|uniref:SP_1767 family glycosyltransferase n=1 Tax=Bacillus sp. V3B TaxID=2804915 RepID=UPI00210E38D6|nr:SP_1767 family glycosyltransferase [Bacillus sp. V3B]MCQ6275297.1 SP_1767 family glycosyltransferase [Bacillus sp. V3B]